MTQMEGRVRQLFGLSIESQITIADTLTPFIEKAATLLIDCLLNGGKLLICGNGRSAINGLHFWSTMIGGCAGVERPPLPAIMLASDPSLITSENHVDTLFARQIQALGQKGDVLIIVSPEMKANNLIHAITAAKAREIAVVALSGSSEPIADLEPADIQINLRADNLIRLSEMQLFILDCFCDLVEQSLFSQI